ncbi:MAG: MarR family winged helix-turn-helix transcriptional regulator [Pseudolabrys sp.]
MPTGRSPSTKKRADNGKSRKSGKAVQRRASLGHLTELIGYAVRRAQLAIFRDFRRSFDEFKIRPIQYGVLTVIEANPGLKQIEVCAALGIKRANFVHLINELERRGLAERRSAEDQRANSLHLTRQGKTLMTKLRDINRQHEQRAATNLTEKERGQLINLLNRIRTSTGEDR